jgi:hypothetical protein
LLGNIGQLRSQSLEQIDADILRAQAARDAAIATGESTGALDQLITALTGAREVRRVDIETPTNTADAEQALDRVRNQLLGIDGSVATVSVDANVEAFNRKVAALNASGGLTTLGQAFAGGTDFAPGGVALVGEKGPELVQLPRGSKVFTASETRALANSPTTSNSGNTYIVAAVPGLFSQQSLREFANKLTNAQLEASSAVL